jgi:hypothetical protein
LGKSDQAQDHVVRVVGRQAAIQRVIEKRLRVVEPAAGERKQPQSHPGGAGQPVVIEPLSEVSRLDQVEGGVVEAADRDQLTACCRGGHRALHVPMLWW